MKENYDDTPMHAFLLINMGINKLPKVSRIDVNPICKDDNDNEEEIVPISIEHHATEINNIFDRMELMGIPIRELLRSRKLIR